VLQRRYIHGPGIDDPVVWYEGGGTTDRRFLLSDERGGEKDRSVGTVAVEEIAVVEIAVGARNRHRLRRLVERIVIAFGQHRRRVSSARTLAQTRIARKA